MIDKAACIRLRQQESAQVKRFYATVRAEDPLAQMVHLPTLLPLKPVNYIVVSAEPSLGFATNKSDRDIEAMVAGGYRNFMHSWEDFILHHCLKKKLRSYYATSISKAALQAKSAQSWRDRFLHESLPTFLQEVELLSSKDAVIIPVGSRAARFLEQATLPRPVASPLMHFSRTASRWRSRLPDAHPEAYAAFAERLETIQLIRSADHTLMTLFQIEESIFGNPVPYDLIQERLAYLKESKAGLSESRKQLLFTYLTQLDEQLSPVTTDRAFYEGYDLLALVGLGGL